MDKRLRNERIELRVSKTEKEMIKHRMALCNETNMTRYMRIMAIDGCIFVVDLVLCQDLVQIKMRSSVC